MTRLLKAFMILFLSSAVLAGCAKQPSPSMPRYRVATQIDIYCEQEDFVIHRHYTSTDKMEAVLTYLRLLKPQGTPSVDPITADGDQYEIIVTLLDGRKSVYLQKAHRYFSKGANNWKNIDSYKAAELYALMRNLPSD